MKKVSTLKIIKVIAIIAVIGFIVSKIPVILEAVFTGIIIIGIVYGFGLFIAPSKTKETGDKVLDWLVKK